MLMLWLTMALLLSAGSAFLMIRVPVQAHGVAVVLDSGAAPSVPAQATMAVFLPESNLSNLRVGQKVSWRFGDAKERVSRTLIAVEPEINSPAALQERFGFKGNAAAVINSPMAVAFARLEPAGGDGSSAKYAGSVYRVEVEVGHRRVISFLPVIGSFFRD
jgi:hypothetical protein